MTGKQSIFFLNNRQRIPNFFGSLMQEFREQGVFLSPDGPVEWLACYDRDSQSLHTMCPLLVFQPHSTSVIAPFIQACHQAKISVRTRCGGTGLAGCAVASQGGVLLLTGHLRSILTYEARLGEVSVEPGITPAQLNQLCREDGWYFPLEMATAGVAGIAGCLNTGARGYHQSRFSLLSSIVSLSLVDGRGIEQEVPASLVCGAEGLLGVVTRLLIQLRRISQRRMVFQVKSQWKEILENWEMLNQHSTLTSLMWQGEDSFTCILEGDEWRVKGAFQHLEKIFNVTLLPTNWQFPFPHSLKGQRFIILNQVSLLDQIPALHSYLDDLCQHFHFTYRVWSNLLEGSWHLLISYDFPQRLEQFLEEWMNILQTHQGFLVGRQDVMHEEELRFLQQLQKVYDPEQIFR